MCYFCARFSMNCVSDGGVLISKELYSASVVRDTWSQKSWYLNELWFCMASGVLAIRNTGTNPSGLAHQWASEPSKNP